MATLTETAFYTRRTVKFLGIGLVVFIILRFLFGLVSSLWISFFPPAPPPPTLAFGKLPKISFPDTEIASTSASFTYSLELVEGALSQKTPSLKVFFIPRPAPSFGAADKMKAQASRLGFTADPKRIPGSVNSWRFDNNVYPLAHLDYDQTTGNFHLYYDFRYDLNLFSQKGFTDQGQLSAQALAFFTNLGLVSRDLSQGPQTVTFFKLDIDKLFTTTSLSEADAVAVTFQRSDVLDGKNRYPVLPPDPKQGLISVLFSGSSDQAKKLLEAKYFYSPVDFENYATYPVISFQDAFEKLKQSKAYVAAVSLRGGKQITIRKVYYAYFESQDNQRFLQPIVVFADQNGFLAYVSATSPAWLGE